MPAFPPKFSSPKGAQLQIHHSHQKDVQLWINRNHREIKSPLQRFYRALETCRNQLKSLNIALPTCHVGACSLKRCACAFVQDILAGAGDAVSLLQFSTRGVSTARGVETAKRCHSSLASVSSAAGGLQPSSTSTSASLSFESPLLISEPPTPAPCVSASYLCGAIMDWCCLPMLI